MVNRESYTAEEVSQALESVGRPIPTEMIERWVYARESQDIRTIVQRPFFARDVHGKEDAIPLYAIGTFANEIGLNGESEQFLDNLRRSTRSSEPYL